MNSYLACVEVGTAHLTGFKITFFAIGGMFFVRAVGVAIGRNGDLHGGRGILTAGYVFQAISAVCLGVLICRRDPESLLWWGAVGGSVLAGLFGRKMQD